MEVWDRIVEALVKALEGIITYLPNIIGAIVVILIGYLIGLLVSKALSYVINNVFAKPMEKTRFGKAFKEAGIDYGSLVGGAIMALIIVASIVAAIDILGLTGAIRDLVSSIARSILNIVAGIAVLVIGIPLAVMASEWISKLLFATLGEKHEFASSLAFSVTSLVLSVFIIGIALLVMFNYGVLLNYLMANAPGFISAAIVLFIGYLLGHAIGKIVASITERVVSKPLETTEIGKTIKEANIDLPGLIGGLTKAFIIVVAVVVALTTMNITGLAGELTYNVASYLPKLIGGITILTLGLILVIVLAKYIGRFIKTAFKGRYEELGSLAENIILLGLIATVITIALNILGLFGNLVFSLILGVVIIVAGVFIAEIVGKLMKESHPTYEKMVPFLETLIILIFILVGVGGVFSQFVEVGDVIKYISIGLGIAFAIVLIPIAFYYARLSWREASS